MFLPEIEIQESQRYRKGNILSSRVEERTIKLKIKNMNYQKNNEKKEKKKNAKRKNTKRAKRKERRFKN